MMPKASARTAVAVGASAALVIAVASGLTTSEVASTTIASVGLLLAAVYTVTVCVVLPRVMDVLLNSWAVCFGYSAASVVTAFGIGVLRHRSPLISIDHMRSAVTHGLVLAPVALSMMTLLIRWVWTYSRGARRLW